MKNTRPDPCINYSCKMEDTMPKVLIVEDDEVYRRFLESVLSKAGYEIVGSVNGGHAAIESASKSEPEIVILDIQLGNSIDGVETARRLRAFTDIPIIFISSYDSDTFVEKTREVHAAGCLVKPIKLPDLEVTIQSALTRYQYEKHLKTEEAFANQARKMETVGLFAGGIAHEFNSLLTVMLGYAKFGQKQVPPESPALVTFKEIYETARKASNLTRQLLAFSSHQMYELVKTDVKELVRRSIQFAKAYIGSDMEVVEEFEESAMVIMADPPHLEQALVNIYRNAREAMPDGGNMVVSCQRRSPDHCRRHQGSPGRDNWVCISVKDTGIGMDRKDLEKVFDPFYTTKPRGEGAGLGLSVAHGVVKQHHGIIQIESEKNMGTQVNIFIPLEAAIRIEKPASSVLAHKGTILIAEDTELLKKMLNTILTDLGYDILLASDGEEAIRVFRQNADKIQVVLLDMVMPKKTGREVYEILAPEANHAKFLLSSGYTTDSDILAFARANRIELIPKPYDPDDLARKIQALVNQKN